MEATGTIARQPIAGAENGPPAAKAPMASKVVLPDTATVSINMGHVDSTAGLTTINYTVTNHSQSLVNLSLIRCDALDSKGQIAASAFDYVDNIDVGKTINRNVQISALLTKESSRFTCYDDKVNQ